MPCAVELSLLTVASVVKCSPLLIHLAAPSNMERHVPVMVSTDTDTDRRARKIATRPQRGPRKPLIRD